MQQIYKKIDDILKIKFPDPKKREEKLAQVGEIAILETLNEVLEKLPSDVERKKITDMFKNGDIGETFDYAEQFGVRMEEIFMEKSKSVVTDLFS